MKNLMVGISVILQLLGLTGVVDGLIQWGRFGLQISEVVQNLYDFLFGWVPIQNFEYFIAYLVFGLGVGMAHQTAYIKVICDDDPKRPLEGTYFSSLLFATFREIPLEFSLDIAAKAVAFPVVIVWNIRSFTYKGSSEDATPVTDRLSRRQRLSISRAFWKYNLISVISLISILYVFSDIHNRL